MESHKINALLKDLKKEEVTGDIEAVNIGGLISDLEQKQREFEQITQEKVEKKAQSTAKIFSIYVTKAPLTSVLNPCYWAADQPFNIPY